MLRSVGVVRVMPRLVIALVAGIAIAASTSADAAKRRTAQWDPGKYAAIVIDANTDDVLFAKNADSTRYPASLTKIMTLYVVFDELSAGRLRKDTRMSVSSYASNQAPSKLGLKPGDTISVDDAIRALVTKSANDVAVVIAEHISGSESAFAERMTATARRIGMKNTTYRNASGLPNPGQRTTARDLSVLGRAIQRNHPTYYPYFKTTSFSYKGRYYRNHNRLLGRVDGIDGIKTGYINASGFNLTSSLRRNKRHLVAVVMGGPSGATRDAHMRQLLERYLPKASTTNTIRQQREQKPMLLVDAPVPSLRPKDEIVVAAAKPDVLPAVLPAQRPQSAEPAVAAAAEPAAEAPQKTILQPRLIATTSTVEAAKSTAQPENATQLAAADPLAENLPAKDESRLSGAADTDTMAIAAAVLGRAAPKLEKAATTTIVAAQQPVRPVPTTPLAPANDNDPAKPQVSIAAAAPPLPAQDDPIGKLALSVLTRQPAAPQAAPLAAGIPLPPLNPAAASDTPAEAPREIAAAAAAPASPAPEALVQANPQLASELARKLNEQWLIQIGAYDQQEAAQARLRDALQEEDGLKNRLGYTEPVQKDDITLYRARFIGFDRNSAKEACAKLKRAKFKCLPMKQ